MEKETAPKPSGWRVTLSIGVSVGWLIFIILWLAFYAVGYTAYENIAIILVSILLVFLILGASWATWGLRYIPKEGKQMMKLLGFTIRVAVSIAVPFALFIFWIIWFFFYAEGFNIYQNIAIFLVSLLAVGGILGGTWSSWGMRHGKKLEEICDEDK
jgi:cation transport ATPase